ncbi:MAG: hypothetical protein ACU84H_09340 [Gammaproteobacteria bacterium]
MLTIRKVLSVLIILGFVSIAAFTLPKSAAANAGPSVDSLDLIQSACPSGSGQYHELNQLKDRIAAAETVAQARTLALAPTDDAIGALKNARTFMPFSEDLSSAEIRLTDARSRILVASSQARVADEFSGMMLAGLDSDRAARLDVGKAKCSYSTGEVIAIVVGLILGIIPGIILLIVLC